jgi:hypothetical protein
MSEVSCFSNSSTNTFDGRVTRPACREIKESIRAKASIFFSFLHLFTDSIKGKCQYHSPWAPVGIGYIQDTPDYDFLEEFKDFAIYFEESYCAFGKQLNPVTVLKDAAGLYHYCRENLLLGIMDEGIDPTENNNMLRFNQFILREYDQILQACRKKRKVASTHQGIA